MLHVHFAHFIRLEIHRIDIYLSVISSPFVRYIHSCDTGRLEVTELVCGGKELAVV